MSESFEFRPVDWITAGAVGSPGDRTFFIQAQKAGTVLSIVVEKGQVRTLSQLAQELLSRVGTTVVPDDLDESVQRVREPVMPLWRAGTIGLGVDEEGDNFVLEATELTEDEGDPAEVRLWMSRDQLVSMAAYAAFTVEAGARETCRLCARPIDPIGGHVCPSTNGHGALTV